MSIHPAQAAAGGYAGARGLRYSSGGSDILRGDGGITSCPTQIGRNPSFGDLNEDEKQQIQNAINKAGRPIHVGGNAAIGGRRNVGSDLPIGKGPGTKSDMDFIIPHFLVEYWEPYKNSLPGVNPANGLIYGIPKPFMGPFISFESK